MLSVRSLADRIMSWIAANARSFSYLLPDTLELALYLCLAAYYAMQLTQQAS
jgi:hypothetical protein